MFVSSNTLESFLLIKNKNSQKLFKFNSFETFSKSFIRIKINYVYF